MKELFEVYTMVHIIEYKLLLIELEEELSGGEYLYKVFSNLEEAINAQEYKGNHMPLIEIMSKDNKRAIKVWTENDDQLQIRMGLLNQYNSEVQIKIGFKKEEDKEYNYESSGMHNMSCNAHALLSWIKSSLFLNTR